MTRYQEPWAQSGCWQSFCWLTVLRSLKKRVYKCVCERERDITYRFLTIIFIYLIITNLFQSKIEKIFLLFLMALRTTWNNFFMILLAFLGFQYSCILSQCSSFLYSVQVVFICLFHFSWKPANSLVFLKVVSFPKDTSQEGIFFWMKSKSTFNLIDGILIHVKLQNILINCTMRSTKQMYNKQRDLCPWWGREGWWYLNSWRKPFVGDVS